MAEVWAARHRFTQRVVALKLMERHRVTPRVERRFFDEAALQASIRHPGVPAVLDAGKTPDGAVFIAIDMLEGDDLESAIRGQRLRPRETVRVAIRLLDVLAGCHAAGVVHRDVKPANVFLARSSVRAFDVKLIDFGIAVEVDEADRAREVMGTLDYMSPEQARGDRVDPRTDIYGAAAVLYRGLTLRAPFEAFHLDDLLRRFNEERPRSILELRPDLPADLAEVVDRGLALDPAERWARPEDMAQALMLCDADSLALCAEPHRLRRRPTPTVSLVEAPWSDCFGQTDLEPTLVREPEEVRLPV